MKCPGAPSLNVEAEENIVKVIELQNSNLGKLISIFPDDFIASHFSRVKSD